MVFLYSPRRIGTYDDRPSSSNALRKLGIDAWRRDALVRVVADDHPRYVALSAIEEAAADRLFDDARLVTRVADAGDHPRYVAAAADSRADEARRRAPVAEAADHPPR